MAFDKVVFGNKTLSDMFSDVYNNTDRKRTQINSCIENLVKLVQSPEDAAVLGPVIKEFFDVNVKNDEHIVRLVQVAQRLVGVTEKNTDTDMLTEEEKAQLLKNVQKDFDIILQEKEDIESVITNGRG